MLRLSEQLEIVHALGGYQSTLTDSIREHLAQLPIGRTLIGQAAARIGINVDMLVESYQSSIRTSYGGGDKRETHQMIRDHIRTTIQPEIICTRDQAQCCETIIQKHGRTGEYITIVCSIRDRQDVLNIRLLNLEKFCKQYLSDVDDSPPAPKRSFDSIDRIMADISARVSESVEPTPREIWQTTLDQKIKSIVDSIGFREENRRAIIDVISEKYASENPPPAE